MIPQRPRQLALEWPHRPSMERDDLIVTPANRLAVQAIDAWPAWSHPVLYVVGPAGSGKSHLAQAWARKAGAAAVASGSPGALPRPFALFLDDLDRSDVGEADLFALVNAARLGGGSLLVTARVPPLGLALGLPDLASRLQAATIVEIGAPDDELLAGVLAKLFADRQIEVEPKLLPFLLTRMERSLEAARELVARVDRESLAAGRRVTRPLIQDLLAERSRARDESS